MICHVQYASYLHMYLCYLESWLYMYMYACKCGLLHFSTVASCTNCNLVDINVNFFYAIQFVCSKNFFVQIIILVLSINLDSFHFIDFNIATCFRFSLTQPDHVFFHAGHCHYIYSVGTYSYYIVILPCAKITV